MEDELTFSHIIDGLSAPIATTTADGRVDLVNKQFLDYLGMSLEELRDWETSGAVHPDDLPRVVAAWKRSLERGEAYEAEQRIRRADGIYQWVHIRGLPLSCRLMFGTIQRQSDHGRFREATRNALVDAGIDIGQRAV